MSDIEMRLRVAACLIGSLGIALAWLRVRVHALERRLEALESEERE